MAAERHSSLRLPSPVGVGRASAAAPERQIEKADGGAGGARSVRTRILLSYGVLLAASALLSTFAIRELLVIRLDDRTGHALRQEVLEFNRFLADGRDPRTGRRFTSLAHLFDVYFARNVPSNGEAMLAFVEGRLYRSALERFPIGRVPTPKLAEWTALSGASRTRAVRTGTYATELGHAHYQARPILFDPGSSSGAFVVTILPAGELAEIRELQTYGLGATLVVVVLASCVALLLAGRILAPVRLLTETARAISESDLTSRVPVRGRDEAAEMARSFNAMLDRLAAVFRGQREFIRDASHELRHPLTITRASLELLNAEPLERAQTVELLTDEVDRMARIVDDLQLLAEAEHPDFLNAERIDLRRFTRQLAKKASALGPRQWAVAGIAEGELVADRHRLTEAVLNLAENAVRNTGERDAIAVGSAASNGEIRIWVSDSGPGVTPADRDRIFRRFARGADARRRYRGSGLGLSIVTAIAEAHGGRVELETTPGAGSTFTIVLPGAPASNQRPT